MPGAFSGLTDVSSQAKQAFGEAYEQQTSVSAGLCLAMIADQEKDPKRRDALLKEIVTKHRAKAPKSAAICQLLNETVFDPTGKKPLDVAALDRLVESVPEEGRGNICFFVGWFLKNHDDAKNSKRYLQACSQSPRSLIWYRYLADEATKRTAGD